MAVTWKDKYNKKYGFEKGTSHSLSAISKTTGYKLSGLQTIFRKGKGAYYSNPQSVRPVVKRSGGANRWAYGRIYSAVMGGKAAKVDKSHLIKK
jgi:hypothetical protein